MSEKPKEAGEAATPAPTKRAGVFDEIAHEYAAKDPAVMPMRIHSEVYTLFEVLPNVPESSILELACSDGYFSRLLGGCGAKKVVAIDISPEMIALAQAAHTTPDPRLEYLVRDARNMGTLGAFDAVFTPYLLDHAHTRDELRQMCETAFKNLEPGGRFVALSNHPDSFPADALVEHFGLTKEKPDPFQDETPFVLTLVVPVEGSDELQRIPFTGYYYAKATFEATLREVGFEAIRWHELRVSPEGMKEHGEAYWEAYLQNPCNIALEARRPR